MENNQANATPAQESVKVEATPVQTVEKKGNEKIVLVIVGVLMLLLFLCCCSFFFFSTFLSGFVTEFEKQFEEAYNEEINEQLNQETMPNSQEGDDNQGSIEMMGTYSVGDSVETSNFKILVSEFEDPYTPTDEFYTQTEGYRLVSTLVEMENISGVEEYLSSNYFQIMDDENSTYDSFYAYLKQPELESGELPVNGKITGWVTFAVPETSKDFKLIYTDPYIEETVVFQLN